MRRERVTAFGAMTSHPQALRNDTPPPSIHPVHRFFSFRATGKEKTRQRTVQQQTDAVFEKNFSQFPFCCSRIVLQLPFPAGTEEYTQAVYFLKNIYFFENKDRHLTVSSHKTSDVCFQAGAFLTVFIGLTKDAFLLQTLFL